jgi:GMP synthase (glutamine-hydrolysing)
VRLLCSDGKPPAQVDIPELKNILPIKSVGVQGDARTYARALLIEENLPWEELEKRCTRIINRYKEINRCAWLAGRIADKPFEIIEQNCTKEALDSLRLFDDICLKFLQGNNLYDKIWQMPVVLLPLRIAGKPCIVMRPVNSAEAMTANFAKIDQNLLKNSLWPSLREAGLGALLYDITHKPPATIEWE